MQKLVTKISITGTITCETGLRIGGNKSSLDIGGLDLNIIKNATGEPYIPGSSIKGKLRSLLGKVRGWENADADQGHIKSMFGGGGGKEAGITTRLFVRDAHLNKEHFLKRFPERAKRDFEFSEVKTENVINRSTGKAEHPRSIERVPAESIFDFKIILDIYDGDKAETFMELLLEGFELLELDYLGGHGSRGSGKVKIGVKDISGKEIEAGKITSIPVETCQNYLNMFHTLIS
jgi:CRISPR-associated protein Csm3